MLTAPRRRIHYTEYATHGAEQTINFYVAQHGTALTTRVYWR